MYTAAIKGLSIPDRTYLVLLYIIGKEQSLNSSVTMTTDISPFELHLILKFENGQELTPNEIRKAQKLGIDYPWAAGQGRQPENTNNENEGGDEIGQKKQKVQYTRLPIFQLPLAFSFSLFVLVH